MKNLIPVILLLITIISCQSIKEENCLRKYPNGQCAVQADTINGLIHGEMLHFTETGKISIKSNWENGVQKGDYGGFTADGDTLFYLSNNNKDGAQLSIGHMRFFPIGGEDMLSLYRNLAFIKLEDPLEYNASINFKILNVPNEPLMVSTNAARLSKTPTGYVVHTDSTRSSFSIWVEIGDDKGKTQPLINTEFSIN